MGNRQKMLRTLSQVVGVPESSLDEDSSPDTLEQWNSVSHIQLVLALEEEFAVTFSPEEAIDMLSVRLIELVLEEKGIVLDASP